MAAAHLRAVLHHFGHHTKQLIDVCITKALTPVSLLDEAYKWSPRGGTPCATEPPQSPPSPPLAAPTPSLSAPLLSEQEPAGSSRATKSPAASLIHHAAEAALAAVPLARLPPLQLVLPPPLRWRHAP